MFPCAEPRGASSFVKIVKEHDYKEAGKRIFERRRRYTPFIIHLEILLCTSVAEKLNDHKLWIQLYKLFSQHQQDNIPTRLNYIQRLMNNSFDEAQAILQQLINDPSSVDWELWQLLKKFNVSGLKSSSLKNGKLWKDERTFALATLDECINNFVEGQAIEELDSSIMSFINQHSTQEWALSDLMKLISPFSAVREKVAVLLRRRIGGLTNLNDTVLLISFVRCIDSQYDAETAYEFDASIDQQLRNSMESNNTPSTIRILSLLSVDQCKGSFNSFLRAMHFTDRYIEVSSSNAFPKIQKLVLLLAKGCITEAVKVFKSLEIKHLQLDTLGYLISDHLVNLSYLDIADRFYQEAFMIYDDNRIETWEYLANAFGQGTILNAGEVFEFANKLEHSTQALACIIGTLRVELLAKPIPLLCSYLESLRPSELLLAESFLSRLSDNKDLSILSHIDPSNYLRSLLVDRVEFMTIVDIKCFTAIPVILRAILKTEWTQVLEVLSNVPRDVAPFSYFFDVVFSLNNSIESVGGKSCLEAVSMFRNKVEALSRMDVAFESTWYSSWANVNRIVETCRHIVLAVALAGDGVVTPCLHSCIKELSMTIIEALKSLLFKVINLESPLNSSTANLVKGEWSRSLESMLEISISTFKILERHT